MSELPTHTREIQITGNLTLAHPDTNRPLHCKSVLLRYNATQEQSSLTAAFTIHARSLKDIERLFGVLPRDQILHVEMEADVVQQYHAAFFAAADEQAFLKVGDYVCFMLQHYHLRDQIYIS